MAGVLDCVAGNLIGRITEAAGRPEFCHIRSELRNLETAVRNHKAVLRDAEQKQATNQELGGQLQQLKHAFSKADDLIEELEYEYLEWRVHNRKNDVDERVRQFSSCFSSNFLVSESAAAEINEIAKELDVIEEAMFNFALVEDENEHIKRLKSEMTLRTSITGSQAFTRLLHLKKEAILSDNVDSIVGRDEEKKTIIDELVKDEDDKQKPPPILSIHGDEGMGKTALAKLVYNADEVFRHFDMRIWVCVSEDYDVQRIRSDVLSSATGEKVTDALTGRRLQIRLERNLFGRKFLLVLDDFGALDSGRVSELEKILTMGANGSKIIITTRIEPSDAKIKDRKIETLNNEKSTALFQHIFMKKKLVDMKEIKSEVEKKLVPKCGGAPLAIKWLAGLLCLEPSDGADRPNVKDLSEKLIVEDEVKGGCVLGALRLSYDLMPCYLKPCFHCFSLLPKDYVFYSFEVIQLWMAQGVLHSGGKDPEAVGEQYFHELWSRGLLEDVEEHALGYWFKIHSLVHDLAIQQARKENKNLESLGQSSFVNGNKNLPPLTSDKIPCLSIPVGGGVEPAIDGVPLVKCITKFRQLRFLYLCNSSIEIIPTSIDTLKHLRYLDLRGNQKLKRLPESICKLQSLQTLILAFCPEFEVLPRNIKNLISLRFLWIHTKQASLRKDGIGRLTSLRFLAIGGSENLTQLFDDIDKLKLLQTLIIYDCKSLQTLPEGLKSLSTLCNMAIWGCEQLRFSFSLEFLRLKKLILRGLPALTSLPRWINDSDEYLEVLEIGEFPRLRRLPFWLSNLWELRILGISNCPRLESPMPTSLHYCDMITELRITFCGSLSQRYMGGSNHDDSGIRGIPTIYVDSQKTKPRFALTDLTPKSDGGVPNKDNHFEAEQSTEAATQDGASKQTTIAKPDEVIDEGQFNITKTTVEMKQDRVGEDDHDVGGNQSVGPKHDGPIDVGAGEILEAKHDGATNSKNAEVGKIGANDNGQARGCFSDNIDHDGAEKPAVVTTFEGF